MIKHESLLENIPGIRNEKRGKTKHTKKPTHIHTIAKRKTKPVSLLP